MTLHPANRQPLAPADGSDPGHPSAADVAVCTDRLETLALRFVEFSRNQIAQIEDLCSNLAETATGQDDRKSMARELRQQHILWEQEKAEQAQRIAAEAEMLTAAWDEIEAERRRLMTDESNAASLEAVVEPSPADPSASETHSPGNLFDLGIPGSGHSAALQFQQIRRDIRQHARRHT